MRLWGQGGPSSRWPRLLAAVALAAFFVFAAPARAAEEPPVDWKVDINGRDVGSIGGDDPLRLDPDEPVTVQMTMTNNTDAPLQVRALRLAGSVLRFPFFSYLVGLGTPLEQGQTVERELRLDLADLQGQVNGLIPARLSLIGADRQTLAEESVPVDVRGSVWSASGIYALLAVAVAATLLFRLWLMLMRGTMPANRWIRGVEFAAPGFFLGITVTIGFSQARLVTPDPIAALPTVLLFTAGGFLLGYLLPLGRAQQAAYQGTHVHGAALPSQREGVEEVSRSRVT
jgi:hypothetical protein